MSEENWQHADEQRGYLQGEEAAFKKFGEAVDHAIAALALDLQRTPPYRGMEYAKVLQRAEDRYRHLFLAFYDMEVRPAFRRKNNDHEDDGA